MAYRMTPARKAALRKAQLASARKRRKSGKKRVTRKRVLVAGAVLAGGVATYAGGKHALNNPKKYGGLGSKLDKAITTGYYYANYPAFRFQGKSLKQELNAHNKRSMNVVRRFREVRALYRQGVRLSPQAKVVYREDVRQRATHRLRRIKNQKTIGFSYDSGKALSSRFKRQYRKAGR